MATQLDPFTGEDTLPVSAAQAYAALTDVETLARVIPDRVSSERVDDRTLRCTVRPGFTFLRANMKLTLTITRASPDTAVDMHITSQGIGAAMDIDCRMRIQGDNGTSRIAWEAQINQLSGLIAAVSPALIRSAADKVICDGWEALRAELVK
jgi:carbon monoxide dehydrogenase subunit G